jgi:hypothetical protein
MRTTLKSILSDEQMGVFDGLMLSDAHLHKTYSPTANSSFRMGVKHFGFVNAVKNYLPLLWPVVSPCPYTLPVDKRTGKRYSGWRLQSARDIFLSEQRKRWYPEGKKIVPNDINLTPACLLWWYLGDGCLAKKKNRPLYRRIVLCTDSFTDDDVALLIRILKEKLGEDSIYPEGGHIVLGRRSLCQFTEAIGKTSPVPEYNYKFDFGQYQNSDYIDKSYAVRKSVLDFGDRMRKSNSKQVLCIETGKIFPSATETAKQIGYSISAVARAIQLGCACDGAHWRYVNKENRS